MLRGLQVQVVGALVVHLEAKHASPVAVGQEELRIGICIALRGQPPDDFETLGDESVAIFPDRSLVRRVGADLLGGVDEVLGVHKVRFDIWIAFDPLAIVVNVLSCVRRGAEVNCLGLLPRTKIHRGSRA